MSKLIKNKHFRFGLPFMIAVVGGSFGLQYYTQLRYDVHNAHHTMTKIKTGAPLAPSKITTLEEEYEEYTKKVDLDNWQNIRGPRPWENDNEDYKDLIERRAEESKKKWTFGSTPTK